MIFKKSSQKKKKNQNPSRYYNSITNLKFQHKKSSYKIQNYYYLWDQNPLSYYILYNESKHNQYPCLGSRQGQQTKVQNDSYQWVFGNLHFLQSLMNSFLNSRLREMYIIKYRFSPLWTFFLHAMKELIISLFYLKLKDFFQLYSTFKPPPIPQKICQKEKKPSIYGLVLPG